jgi:hypothetical protein
VAQLVKKKKKDKNPQKLGVTSKSVPKETVVTVTAPDSLLLLKIRVKNELLNYATWLRDGPTWAGRSAEVQTRLIQARTVLGHAEHLHNEACKLHHQSVFSKWKRQDSQQYEKDHGPSIRETVDGIRADFGTIDELVQEPPVPPRTWGNFMGDTNSYTYHAGTKSDPIPVVWYKDETHYAPIKIKSKTYTYPKGPEVQGRLKKYKIAVDGRYRFKLGDVIENRKMNEKRTTQVDINYALKQAGASMAGLDGDHVRDLGFGGVDSDKNYWPLKAEINRRPFLGWRATYGVNYISQNNVPSTAALGALNGKFLKIKAFMDGGAANVPAEGNTPDSKSGSTTV